MELWKEDKKKGEKDTVLLGANQPTSFLVFLNIISSWENLQNYKWFRIDTIGVFFTIIVQDKRLIS